MDKRNVLNEQDLKQVNGGSDPAAATDTGDTGFPSPRIGAQKTCRVPNPDDLIVTLIPEEERLP